MQALTEKTMKKMYLALWLPCLVLAAARAEAPVDFGDPRLKAAVEEELWISDPTPTDMLGLTELECEGAQMEDLTGIEYASNLQSLDLRMNWVSDLSFLSGLTHLCYLNLEANLIDDLSPLSSLDNLQELILKQNRVSDLSTLSGLAHLETLNLHRNEVSDLSPLTALTSLQSLDLRLNPLSREAYITHIPEIIANNPGIWIRYDPAFGRQLVVSSTAGGSVIRPGEGDFEYEFRQSVWLEAKADPCFVFARWSGSFVDSHNPALLTMDEDHEIRAIFLSTRDTIYVDDDAPGDVRPQDASASDPCEIGTFEHPFDTIQEAIDVAAEGANVLVADGIYRETIDLAGKSIQVRAFCPNDPSGVVWPVIDGAGNGPVVQFVSGEDPNCMLVGFVITGGYGQLAGAIRCANSSPTVANCLIVGNRVTHSDGSPIYCTDSGVVFMNCTIADNYGGEYAAGLYARNSHVTVVNSILWGNGPKEILVRDGEGPSICYSVVAGGWPGLGILHVDPRFVRTGRWVDRTYPDIVIGPEHYNALWVMGDYHLQSQAGRWDPQMSEWVLDAVTSPCIDAGDPAAPAGREPAPNGGIINLGVYGGTAEASRSCPDSGTCGH
jgi:hypothetical protein